MVRKNIWILVFSSLLSINSFADNICGRTASVNHQEVVIDTNSTKKGEGLRFYLNKDVEAKRLLDLYQQKSAPKWYNAAIGTFGTSLLLYGIIRPGSHNEGRGIDNKLILMTCGASVLLLNYLVIKTMEYKNERLLLRSIEEYNKRNLPKIYFYPFKDQQSGKNTSSNALGLSVGIIKEF